MISIENFYFGMGHTIEAILRLKNPLVEKGPQLEELVQLFNSLNNNECTFIGRGYKIPLDSRYQIQENE
jgi:hypothetical protein